MTGARVSPGTRRQLGWFGWTFTRLAGLRTRTAPPALFTVLGRHRGLFRRWLVFASALMPGGRLPRRDTELVILRVATLRASDYELRQHVRLGRAAGLTAEEIDRVRDPSAEWEGRDRVLITSADALVRDRDLDDGTWRALRTELSEVECLEFCLLVTHYDLLATVIGTLRIPPDEPR
ncbi:carboxymuconolactone decarboxylase family protein [Actinophytocola glycyrrhizae]|uniref:Carboxymuconolactone decarboxylase family protein n=1 Tax=Actinophytocola glycyrrhizae TaxID=2044873 RepID=A0ABV9RTG7_9PSEU